MNPKEWYVVEHNEDTIRAGEPRFHLYSSRLHDAESSEELRVKKLTKKQKSYVQKLDIKYEIDKDYYLIGKSDLADMSWRYTILMRGDGFVINDAVGLELLDGGFTDLVITLNEDVDDEKVEVALEKALEIHASDFLKSSEYRRMRISVIADEIQSLIKSNLFNLDEVFNLVRVKMVMES